MRRQGLWSGGGKAEDSHSICRDRIEQTVEDVLELRADLELNAFFDAENAAEAERLGRLALPTEVIIVRGRLTELSCRRVGPSIGIQHQLRGRIEVAIGIHIE